MGRGTGRSMEQARTGVMTLLAVVLGIVPGMASAADDAAAARQTKVETGKLEGAALPPETGITAIHPRVLDAMLEVPRHAFVPEPLRPYAYAPTPLPVTHDQNIAAPLLIALMTHVAAVQPEDV